MPAAGRHRRTARRRRARRDRTAPDIAITADSFVVRPLRFPGGSIGELAVNGTVNDLAVSGARAQTLVVTFVLEAGLATSDARGRGARDGRCGAAGRRRDRRRRHQGRRARTRGRDVHHHGRHRTAASRSAPSTARSVRVGDRILLSGLHRRPRHHHPAGARRPGSRGRSPVGHALGVAVGRSAG